MAPLPRRYTNEDWAIEDVLEEPGRLKRWISTLYPVFKPHAFRSTKKRPNDVEIGRISGIRNGLQREAGQLPPAGIKDPAALHLIDSVFGEDVTPPDLELKLLRECQEWYLSFINWKIEAAWESLIKPTLELVGDANDDTPKVSPRTPPAGQKKMYEVLAKAADMMRSKDKRGLSLADIVKRLKRDGKLKKGDIQTCSGATHLVFSSIGWLTMLYEPVLHPDDNKLQLQEPKLKGKRRGFRTNVIRDFSQDFSTLAHDISITEQPFHRLLHRFGTIIPYPDDTFDAREAAWSHDPQRVRDLLSDRAFENTILVPHVCYNTLIKIIRIRIQWVDSLNLHLEFDPGTRTLKLFRWPAFCWLMCRNSGSSGEILLSRLFKEKWSEMDESFNGECGFGPQPEDFFREILLSYRLIFGQDKESRKTYRKQKQQQQNQDQSQPDSNCSGLERWQDHQQHRQQAPLSLQTPSSPQPPPPPPPPSDPLIPLLCGQNWLKDLNSLTVYSSIHANTDISTHYDASTDFPFFGQRLLALQRFSKNQNPHDWKVLWYDRRNAFNWWTIWAVVFIGGGALVLSFLTLVFQIVQTFWGRKG